jgi:hypothetical protein
LSGRWDEVRRRNVAVPGVLVSAGRRFLDWFGPGLAFTVVFGEALA